MSTPKCEPSSSNPTTADLPMDDEEEDDVYYSDILTDQSLPKKRMTEMVRYIRQEEQHAVPAQEIGVFQNVMDELRSLNWVKRHAQTVRPKSGKKGAGVKSVLLNSRFKTDNEFLRAYQTRYLEFHEEERIIWRGGWRNLQCIVQPITIPGKSSAEQTTVVWINIITACRGQKKGADRLVVDTLVGSPDRLDKLVSKILPVIFNDGQPLTMKLIVPKELVQSVTPQFVSFLPRRVESFDDFLGHWNSCWGTHHSYVVKPVD